MPERHIKLSVLRFDLTLFQPFSKAVRRLTVEQMPLTVILDSVGGNLYKSGPAAYLASR